MGDTVIIGAGIIGLSTAYFLSESPRTAASKIHLVDSSSELFHCASGLAGGFIASDWFSPTVASLGSLSFKLHASLAEKHNGRRRWGYSKSIATSLAPADDDAVGGSGADWRQGATGDVDASMASPSATEFKLGEGPKWLYREEGATLEIISGDENVGQVDPKRLCEFLLEQCQERGVNLHQPASVISVSKDSKDQLASVRIATTTGIESDVPCTRLIITAGAWTPKVYKSLFPSSRVKIPITSLAGYSLLMKSTDIGTEQAADVTQPCHAVFAVSPLGFSPEIFSRVDGELYIAGLNTATAKLPDCATDVKAENEEALEKLRKGAGELVGLGTKNGVSIVRESMCFRPVTGSGRPVISRVPDHLLGGGIWTRGGGEGGVFVAGGHGAWGISMSLGTGRVLSELVEGRPNSANIKALSLQLE